MSRLSLVNRVIFVLALAVLLAAILLGNAPQSIRSRITRTPLCWSRILLHRECPGCGLTRSFMAIGRGSLKEAGELNPLGPILFVGLALLVVTRLGRMASPLANRAWMWLDIAACMVLLVALVARTLLFYRQ